MKIKAKKLLLAQEEKIPEDRIEKQPISPEEEAKILEELYGKQRTSLEGDFERYELSFGDRLRILDSSGNLYDVIMMPDGTIGVQELALKVEYGSFHKFPTWEEAEESLPPYSVEKAINANKHNKALFKLLKKALSETKKTGVNPYVEQDKKSRKLGKS
jgi:hypothetical protein